MKKDIIKSNLIANLVFKKLTLIVMSLLFTTFVMVGSLRAAKIRIALAETPSDELAAIFVALDRAKANGLDYEWTAYFNYFDTVFGHLKHLFLDVKNNVNNN